VAHGAWVRLIPLGGLGEVGLNMICLETAEDCVVLDAGLMFPEEDMLGIDLVIPEFTALLERRQRLRAVVLTHGHEDHTGALPYLLRDLPVPVYGTRLTLALARERLGEAGLDAAADLRTITPDDRLDFGSLRLDRFSPYAGRPEQWGLEVLGPLPHYRLIYFTDESTLNDLAYAFTYRHLDGREPKSYVEPLGRAIEAWRQNTEIGYRALRFRRGPRLLIIHDRRPRLEAADYTFEDAEARLHLACGDGATPVEAWNALDPTDRANLTVDEVREFLNELVTLRLAYEENGRYLTLALPANLPEET